MSDYDERQKELEAIIAFNKRLQEERSLSADEREQRQQEAEQRAVDLALAGHTQAFIETETGLTNHTIRQVVLNRTGKTFRELQKERTARRHQKQDKTFQIPQRWHDIVAFHNGGEKTLEECGKHFGVTRERIRQILKRMGIVGGGKEYRRAHKPPKPPPMTRELLELRCKARIWSRINVTTNPDECWEWTGAYNLEGDYPRVSIHSLHVPEWSKSSSTRGQKAMWYITHNELPKGWVMNTCKNTKCMNPRHLADMQPAEALDLMRDKDYYKILAENARKRWKEASPEQREQWVKTIQEAHSKKSPEERKRWNEKLSAAHKRWWSNLTPEQKAAHTQKALAARQANQKARLTLNGEAEHTEAKQENQDPPKEIRPRFWSRWWGGKE